MLVVSLVTAFTSSHVKAIRGASLACLPGLTFVPGNRHSTSTSTLLALTLTHSRHTKDCIPSFYKLPTLLVRSYAKRCVLYITCAGHAVIESYT